MARLVTFAVALAALAVLVGIPETRPPAKPPVPVRCCATLLLGSPLDRVAVIGDSYTAGSSEGGEGARGWPELAWQKLIRQGMHVVPDVAAEGGAGYGVRGNHGSLFRDLAARAVRADDTLVVFFGSRNDQDVDPAQLAVMIHDTFGLVRRTTPSARLLVIGPPWPTADVPDTVLRVRDILQAEARTAGAEFIDPIAERWFVDRPDLIGADGVHPTDAGHAYMADQIVPLMYAQLPKQA